MGNTACTYAPALGDDLEDWISEMDESCAEEFQVGNCFALPRRLSSNANWSSSWSSWSSDILAKLVDPAGRPASTLPECKTDLKGEYYPFKNGAYQSEAETVDLAEGGWLKWCEELGGSEWWYSTKFWDTDDHFVYADQICVHGNQCVLSEEAQKGCNEMWTQNQMSGMYSEWSCIPEGLEKKYYEVISFDSTL